MHVAWGPQIASLSPVSTFVSVCCAQCGSAQYGRPIAPSFSATYSRSSRRWELEAAAASAEAVRVSRSSGDMRRASPMAAASLLTSPSSSSRRRRPSV